ncbi:LamB/YcsF family protein [Inquilinus limosus]|uniref:LamB/YcsF family protein n=1 Tax=Inquilinus limosus TaxID=171674 RepID=UPI00047DC8E2|nr:5-oxoprolinase subunit PxpA [Inquilinus limosus]
MASVDLNCDMGEGFGAWEMGDDAAMLEIVTSANVACGFHAGDPIVMRRTLTLARDRGIGVGAHPGFLDLWGFGRRVIQGETPEDIEAHVVYQIGAIQGMAKAVGHRVTHVKAHGALSNMAMVDDALALAIGRAIKSVDPALAYMVLPGTALERAALELGLPVVREVFADRTYEDDGTLTSRKIAGSVIHDADLAAERVLRMVEEQAVTSRSGRRIPVPVDTVCVHGDTPGAVGIARRIRERLEKAGIRLVALKDRAA